MKRINLFCLPFAGGNKYSYRKYEEATPDCIQVVTLAYPGRGSRANEHLALDIHTMVEDSYRQIAGKIDSQEYALYGHSMGGLIAYLLTRKILEDHRRPPAHIFITGTTGPSAISRTVKKRHLMGHAEFVQELKELNGSPDELLENEEMLEYFIPILRADCEANDTYVHTESGPVDLPVTVITGTEEDMQLEDILLWQKETTTPIDFIRMPGKHFFIFEYAADIMKIISGKLLDHHKKHSYE